MQRTDNSNGNDTQCHLTGCSSATDVAQWDHFVLILHIKDQTSERSPSVIGDFSQDLLTHYYVEHLNNITCFRLKQTVFQKIRLSVRLLSTPTNSQYFFYNLHHTSDTGFTNTFFHPSLFELFLTITGFQITSMQ